MLIIRQIKHDWEIIQTLEKYDNVFYLIKKKHHTKEETFLTLSSLSLTQSPWVMASRNLSRYYLFPFDYSWLCSNGSIFSHSPTPPFPSLDFGKNGTGSWGVWIVVGNYHRFSFLPEGTLKDGCHMNNSRINRIGANIQYITGKEMRFGMYFLCLEFQRDEQRNKVGGRSHITTKVYSKKIYWKQAIRLCPFWGAELFKDLRRLFISHLSGKEQSHGWPIYPVHKNLGLDQIPPSFHH